MADDSPIPSASIPCRRALAGGDRPSPLPPLADRSLLLTVFSNQFYT